jgi:hypothetical protein
MKRQKSCGPCLGKLVHQLPGVVTFAYDLRFRLAIAHWKGITEKNNSDWLRLVPSVVTWALNAKKTSFRASKRPQKFGTRKTAKVENCFSSQWNRWVATDIHLDHKTTRGPPTLNHDSVDKAGTLCPPPWPHVTTTLPHLPPAINWHHVPTIMVLPPWQYTSPLSRQLTCGSMSLTMSPYGKISNFFQIFQNSEFFKNAQIHNFFPWVAIEDL